METLKFDLQKTYGSFKELNATNGGPWHKRYTNDQYRSNFADYKAARIPYARNHDSNLSGSTYGGPYAHDISAIFPDFGADPYDPKSYDFDCTDEAILTVLDAGTETYFRLGQTIEHQIKKHDILPPKDFKKWAVICEHVIRHYNYGWGNGLKLNIKYWEIWNEADLDKDDSENKRTWGGTKAQFFDLYEVAAKHLKSCFPELKIGGPALAFDEEWGADFLKEMSNRNVPIDFFSWHIYCTTPEKMMQKAARIRKMLDDNGYHATESHLNEWNYVKGWTDEYVYSIKAINGLKGAAFTLACMSESQKSSIDMLMYYDTRPSIFCGAFDYYTCEKKKGYYPLMWYGKFYDMQSELRCVNEPENIYTLCGVDKNDKTLTTVTYYTDDDNAPSKKVTIELKTGATYEVYLVDKDHDGELIATTDTLTFDLAVHSMLLIKEI